MRFHYIIPPVTVADEAVAQSVFELPRRRIADVLRGRPDRWWTVDEIAARRRVHRTVAFSHLERLVAAGVAVKSVVRSGRGRPTNTYRYSGMSIEIAYPPQRTRLLARVLAIAADTGTRPRKVAREFGAAAGGLHSLRGDYKLEGKSIHAITCIFGSVCMEAPDVVCDVHAGLIEGALGMSGVSVVGPDGSGGCRFRASRA